MRGTTTSTPLSEAKKRLLQRLKSSRILPHVLGRRSDRIIRRSKIALMERAHLVRLERTNDGVQHATIVEQDEVLFLPVVRVHQLKRNET